MTWSSPPPRWPEHGARPPPPTPEAALSCPLPSTTAAASDHDFNNDRTANLSNASRTTHDDDESSTPTQDQSIATLITSINLHLPQQTIQSVLSSLHQLLQQQCHRQNDLHAANTQLQSQLTDARRTMDQMEQRMQRMEQQVKIAEAAATAALDASQKDGEAAAERTAQTLREELQTDLSNQVREQSQTAQEALRQRLEQCEGQYGQMQGRLDGVEERQERSMERLRGEVRVLSYNLGFVDDNEEEEEEEEEGQCVDSIGDEEGKVLVKEQEQRTEEEEVIAELCPSEKESRDDTDEEEEERREIAVECNPKEEEADDDRASISTFATTQSNHDGVDEDAAAPNCDNDKSDEGQMDNDPTDGDSSLSVLDLVASTTEPNKSLQQSMQPNARRRLSIANASKRRIDFGETLLSRLQKLENEFDGLRQSVEEAVETISLSSLRPADDNDVNSKASRTLLTVQRRVGDIEHFLEGYIHASIDGYKEKDNGSSDSETRNLSDIISSLENDTKTKIDATSMRIDSLSDELTQEVMKDIVTMKQTIDELIRSRNEVGAGVQPRGMDNNALAELRKDVGRAIEEAELRIEKSLGEKCDQNHSSSENSIQELREVINSMAIESSSSSSSEEEEEEGRDETEEYQNRENDDRIVQALSIIEATQATIKTMEEQLEALVAKLSEKPTVEQVRIMVQTVEESYRERLEGHEALGGLVQNLKESVQQKMTKVEVKAVVKDAVNKARLGLSDEKDSLMIGRRTPYRCIGCDSLFPGGVSNSIARKVNHSALPSSGHGRSFKARRYFHVVPKSNHNGLTKSTTERRRERRRSFGRPMTAIHKHDHII